MSEHDLKKRAPLKWSTPEEAKNSLDVVYVWVEAIAIASRDWYVEKKKWPSSISRGVRGAAIILLAIGGLVPLMTGLTIVNLIPDVDKLGYLALGMAAALLLLDRHGSFSTAWMRYITTDMKLTRMIRTFQLEWQIARARFDLDKEAAADPAKIVGMLVLLRDFVTSVLKEVENETQVWVIEFRDSLAQLQRAISEREKQSDRVEAARTGTLTIEVENFAKYPAVALFVDKVWYGKMSAAQQDVTLFAGAHDVLVRAQKNEEQVEDEAAVVVAAGEQRTAKLRLPPDGGDGPRPADVKPQDDVNLMKTKDGDGVPPGVAPVEPAAPAE
jgi:hypothetical protein